jgi:hypothetical protein
MGWVVSVVPWSPFTPRQRTLGTHWIGGCVGPRAGLDAEARKKNVWPCQGSKPGHPVHSQSLYWLNYLHSCWLIYILKYWSAVLCIFRKLAAQGHHFHDQPLCDQSTDKYVDNLCQQCPVTSCHENQFCQGHTHTHTHIVILDNPWLVYACPLALTASCRHHRLHCIKVGSNPHTFVNCGLLGCDVMQMFTNILEECIHNPHFHCHDDLISHITHLFFHLTKQTSLFASVW